MSTEYLLLDVSADQPYRVAMDEQSGRFSLDFECLLTNNENHYGVWTGCSSNADDTPVEMAWTERRFTPEQMITIAMQILVVVAYHVPDTRIITNTFEAYRKENVW